MSLKLLSFCEKKNFPTCSFISLCWPSYLSWCCQFVSCQCLRPAIGRGAWPNIWPKWKLAACQIKSGGLLLFALKQVDVYDTRYTMLRLLNYTRLCSEVIFCKVCVWEEAACHLCCHHEISFHKGRHYGYALALGRPACLRANVCHFLMLALKDLLIMMLFHASQGRGTGAGPHAWPWRKEGEGVREGTWGAAWSVSIIILPLTLLTRHSWNLDWGDDCAGWLMLREREWAPGHI